MQQPGPNELCCQGFTLVLALTIPCHRPVGTQVNTTLIYVLSAVGGSLVDALSE